MKTLKLACDSLFVLGSELFVKGLPDGIEEKKLKKFFTKHSVDVESIKLLVGRK